MTVVAIAAETLELEPWLKGCASVQELAWPIAFARRVRWNGHDLYALANGAGARLSQAALDEAVNRLQNQGQSIDTLMSIGLCGALDASMPHYALCTASSLGDGAANWPASPLRGLAQTRLLSIDRFLGSPAEKQEWRAKGFDIVEMEAAPLAAWATEHDVPFHAVKVVSDQADESFALDFNQHRDAAGRFDRKSIAWAAVTHPLSYAPSLIRLASRGAAASKKLGAFLAEFQL